MCQQDENAADGLAQEVVRCVSKQKLIVERKTSVKISECKNYDELPLFLNAEMVAKVLGVSPSSSYELMHEPGFPVLKVGSRMVVPKEKFREWVEQHTAGGGGQ